MLSEENNAPLLSTQNFNNYEYTSLAGENINKPKTQLGIDRYITVVKRKKSPKLNLETITQTYQLPSTDSRFLI